MVTGSDILNNLALCPHAIEIEHIGLTTSNIWEMVLILEMQFFSLYMKLVCTGKI